MSRLEYDKRGKSDCNVVLDVSGGTNMEEDIEGQVLVADLDRRDKT